MSGLREAGGEKKRKNVANKLRWPANTFFRVAIAFSIGRKLHCAAAGRWLGSA
jgi:hypothetical protein